MEYLLIDENRAKDREIFNKKRGKLASVRHVTASFIAQNDVA
jgi:hypothetical protein